MGFDSPLWLVFLIIPLILFFISLYSSPEQKISASTLEQWKKRRSLSLPKPGRRKVKLSLNNILTSFTLSLIIMAISSPFTYSKNDQTKKQNTPTIQTENREAYNAGIIAADIMKDRLYLNIYSTDAKTIALNNKGLELRRGHNNVILDQIADKVEIFADDEEKRDNTLETSVLIMSVNFKGEKGELYRLISNIPWIKITSSSTPDLLILNNTDITNENGNLISILTPVNKTSFGKDIAVPEINIASDFLQSLNYISEGPYIAKELLIGNNGQEVSILSSHKNSPIIALEQSDGQIRFISSIDFDKILAKDPGFAVFIYNTLNLFKEGARQTQKTITTGEAGLKIPYRLQNSENMTRHTMIIKQHITKTLTAINIILVFIYLLLQLRKP